MRAMCSGSSQSDIVRGGFCAAFVTMIRVSNLAEDNIVGAIEDRTKGAQRLRA